MHYIYIRFSNDCALVPSVVLDLDNSHKTLILICKFVSGAKAETEVDREERQPEMRDVFHNICICIFYAIFVRIPRAENALKFL